MKKRILAAVLSLTLLFCLCSCDMPTLNAKPEPTPTAEPTPTPTPEPADALGRWIERADARYNMRYEDFADYWCLTCDEYFGEDMHDLLRLISSCENTDFDIEEANEQIVDQRMEYLKRGGDNWGFEITSHTEETLDSTACVNFSDELQHLNEQISAVISKSETWSDSQWHDFADSLGCDLACARSIIEAYRAIAEKCGDVSVTSAMAIELNVTFSDGTELNDSTTLYEIDGEYVCTELIDSASLLIQLIYF